MAASPFLDLSEPFLCARFVARLLELLVDATQNDLRIAHDRNLRNTVLANFGRIHIDMDNLRIRRKIGKLAGNAIREARADRDEQIGIGYRIVRELGTVHAHKTQAERIGCRNAPLPISVETTGICSFSATASNSFSEWDAMMPPPM